MNLLEQWLAEREAREVRRDRQTVAYPEGQPLQYAVVERPAGPTVPIR